LPLLSLATIDYNKAQLRNAGIRIARQCNQPCLVRSGIGIVRKERLGETETFEVADSHRVENPVEMIAFVLHSKAEELFESMIHNIPARIVTTPYLT